MNRNTNSHFNEIPNVNIQRSTFDRSHGHKLSGNVGDVIPIFCDTDILPGDTVSMDTSKIIRFQTLLTPMMDNLYADIYWFFIPHRLVWDHWVNLMGQNDSGPWAPSVEYSVPKFKVPAPAGEGDTPNNNKVGTILDYLGYPVALSDQTEDVEVSALRIRAYCKVMEDWFRKEAVSDPINLYTGDNTVTATTEASYVNDLPHGGVPFKAAKFADYFTSCLPSPQRGDPVSISMDAPSRFPVKTAGEIVWSAGADDYAVAFAQRTGPAATSNSYQQLSMAASGYNFFGGGAMTDANFEDNIKKISNAGSSNMPSAPVNLFADTTGLGLSFTVNDLRFAFQLQKLLERDARGGGRYIEIIKTHFNVNSPDQRLQRSEYLGGNRFPISINQVQNTAQTESDFLGDLGAYSVTGDVHSDFTKSFTEHGTLLGLMVVRHDHTYCQGLDASWQRFNRFDFYWPVFANIGEQPVKKNEIYLTGSGTFGYQEAWASYRYMSNRCSGLLRPYVQAGLWSWTLADDYDSAPSLSDGWIREGVSEVDRVLAVTSQVSDQFWADFWFKYIHTRPMPVYSVPGLIDHN